MAVMDDSDLPFEPSKRHGAVGGIFPNGSRLYVSHGHNKKLFSDTLSYSTTDRAWFRGKHSRIKHKSFKHEVNIYV